MAPKVKVPSPKKAASAVVAAPKKAAGAVAAAPKKAADAVVAVPKKAAGAVAAAPKKAAGAVAAAPKKAAGAVAAVPSKVVAAVPVGKSEKVDKTEKKAAKAEKKAAKAEKKAAKQSKSIVRGTDPVEIMTARLFFTAAFPTIQVLLDDDPKLKKKFAKTNKTIQFGARNGRDLLCCTMRIENGKITSEEGPAVKPDLKLTFASVEQMNALLKGGLAVPAISGSKKLLADFLPLLLGLKVMAKPNKDLKNDAEKQLKVKMSLYMITRALSKYNKLGDPDMVEFCKRQPERIYQFAVDDKGEKNVIACYLRIAQGNSKSGHGIYERRTPFVLFHFFSIEGALKVLGGECEFVEGVEKGYVETIGSPEYACYLNDYMAIIQGMMM